MKKLGFLSISMSLVFIATLMYTVRITKNLNQYLEKKIEVAELLDSRNRMGDAWEWVPIDFLNPAADKMEKKAELEEIANAKYAKASKDGWIMLGIVVGFLLINIIVYRNSEVKQQAIGLSLVFASMSFLYLGLNSPFLEIEAFMDDFAISADIGIGEPELQIDGRIYALYQNKSVLELIKLLYLGGNFVVAILILMFSIVFPTVKLVSSVIVFLAPSSQFSKYAVTVIDKLGKWSMADVMVASIFLAYFSFANMNVGVETGSSTLIGLYFFSAFVVFSIFSGSYLKRTVIQANQKNGG